MRPEDIFEIWINKAIADKIWSKHAVTEEEVYEVFENGEDVMKVRRSGQVSGSYLVFGRTLAGRYLIVALFPKEAGRCNVATARDMTNAERRQYERK